MKKVLTIACFMPVAAAAQAQVTVTPEFGGNLSKFFGYTYDADANERHTTYYDWMLGPKAGIGIDIPIGSNGFSIEPMVNYSVRTSRLTHDTEDSLLQTTTAFSFVEVPINLKYSWSIKRYTGKLFVQAAPYVAYGLQGKSKYVETVKKPLHSTTETTGDVVWGDSEPHEFRNLDYGAYFGIGYQFEWGLQIRANYGLSLGNMSNVTDAKYNPGSVFNFTVGYVFGRKKAGRFY